MGNSMTWNKWKNSDIDVLKDHYYYLVTCKKYRTPMKAKWHSEGYFEVFIGQGKPNIFVYMPDDEGNYAYDENTESDEKIIAWMEMPEIYSD